MHRGAAVKGEIPLAHFNPSFHNPQGLNKCTNIIYCNACSMGGFSPWNPLQHLQVSVVKYAVSVLYLVACKYSLSWAQSDERPGVRNSAQAEANRKRAGSRSSFLTAHILQWHRGTAVTAERGQRSQDYTRHFLKIKDAAMVLILPSSTHWEYEMRF